MEAAYKLTSPDQGTDLNDLPQQMVTKYSHSQQERKAADSLLARILIVSRRTLRKNKFVDFVGEYHLDLIVKYGEVPIIVPRVSGVQHMLHSFEPIHGVLLCEGEDVGPSLYDNDDDSDLSREELDEIQRLHSSDTAIDRTKDSIELQLTRRCLERNIPYLGICRGSQILNVACGGTLYQDVEKELCKKSGCAVKHINYDEYDGHRHPLRVAADTPLHLWFQDSFKGDNLDIMVNSYHHQGIKKLPERFKAMAYAPDGLVEAFYDPNAYNPEKGKFVMGLQFHPERMRCDQDQHDTEIVSESVFDYPGCPRVYQEFVKAVIAYRKITMLSCHEELEKKKKRIVRRFSVATLIDDDDANTHKSEDAQDNNSLHPASLLLKMNGRLSVRALDREEEKRLKQIGATVRNSASYMKKAKMNEEKKEAALTIMESMSTQQLSDLLAFYEMMSDVGSEVLEEKLTSSTP